MATIIVCVYYLMIGVQLKGMSKNNKTVYLPGIDPKSPLCQVYNSIRLDHFHLAIGIEHRHVSDETLFEKSKHFKFVRHLSLVPSMWWSHKEHENVASLSLEIRRYTANPQYPPPAKTTNCTRDTHVEHRDVQDFSCQRDNRRYYLYELRKLLIQPSSSQNYYWTVLYPSNTWSLWPPIE